MIFLLCLYVCQASAVLRLSIGEQRLLRQAQLKSFMQLRTILSIRETKDRDVLMVKARQVGLTELVMETTRGEKHHLQVEVYQTKALKPLSEGFLKLLEHLPEVELHWAHPQWLLSGKISSEEEAKWLERVERLYKKDVALDLEMGQALYLHYKAKLEEALAQSPEVQAELIQSRWLLVAEGLSEVALKKFEQVLHLPAVRFQFEERKVSPVLHFKVLIFEIQRRVLERLGIRWSTELMYVVQPFQSSVKGSLSATLDQLSLKGEVQVISQPELVVQVPGEASFFSGGELPIALHRRYRSALEWRKHGMCLQLKVLGLREGRVQLHILTENSELGAGVGTDQIPGLRSNKMETEVEVPLRVPILLGGLLQKRASKQEEGWLSRIPILKYLFGTEASQEEETELVAFLYPTLFSHLDKRLQAFQPRTPSKEIKRPTVEQETRLRQDPNFPWNLFE